MIFKKHIKNILLRIIIIFIGFALSGCTYSETIKKELLHMPMNESKNYDHELVIVYGISFEQLNTILRIKKFSTQYLNKDLIKLNHGLSYALDYNETSTGLILELKMILKRHHFDSLKQFTEKYSSVQSIIANSDFKAVPKKLGQELFFLIQKANFDYPDPVPWQP